MDVVMAPDEVVVMALGKVIAREVAEEVRADQKVVDAYLGMDEAQAGSRRRGGFAMSEVGSR